MQLPEDLLEQLETECELVGFDGPAVYLRWLVENRATMRGDGNQILAAYAERLRELEGRPGRDGTGDPTARRGDADSGDPSGVGVGPTDDGRGCLRANLTPATARLEDDAVAEVADELRGARDGRMDEVVRRAVARTRRRLGEGTDTGLAYRSTAAVGRDGPRPGSEIADLGAIEVPGRDEALVERRRTAVGAALAFLRDEGRARRAEFVEALYDEYPAGYSTADGWWRCVKRGLRQVDRVDGAGERSRTWRYRDYGGRVRVVEE